MCIRDSIRVSFPEDSCLSFVAMEGISGEISAVPLFMGKIKGASLNAVSYTHLDVYKRQVSYKRNNV